jgi:hypothetical protein
VQLDRISILPETRRKARGSECADLNAGIQRKGCWYTSEPMDHDA